MRGLKREWSSKNHAPIFLRVTARTAQRILAIVEASARVSVSHILQPHLNGAGYRITKFSSWAAAMISYFVTKLRAAV